MNIDYLSVFHMLIIMKMYETHFPNHHEILVMK